MMKQSENIFELIVEEPTHYLKYYIGFLEFEELKTETKLLNINNYNDKSFTRQCSPSDLHHLI